MGYYRCYIPNLAAVASPLYSLTKKGRPFRWDPKCEEAWYANIWYGSKWRWSIKSGRSHFISKRMRVRWVWRVLSQADERTQVLRPICYHSTALGLAQRNYSASQLEAGTLVSAASKWSVYLKAAPEVVFLTDHNPLKWMRRQKDPRHTFARWLLELEELPYRIEYIPGSENQVADYLSRIPNLEYDEELNSDDVLRIGCTIRGRPRTPWSG